MGTLIIIIIIIVLFSDVGTLVTANGNHDTLRICMESEKRIR